MKTLLLTILFSLLLCISCSKESGSLPTQVIITIDDAPNFPEQTGKMLDVLKKHNVQAMFFCIGMYIDQQPELMKRIINEGHVIGNHTYTHLNITEETKLKRNYLGNYERPYTIDMIYTDEIIPTQTIIKKYSKQSIQYFRAPYGALDNSNELFIKSQNYEIIWWNYDASDWDPNVSLENIQNYYLKVFKKGIKDNSIILFHLTENSVSGLDWLLTLLEEKHIKTTLL